MEPWGGGGGGGGGGGNGIVKATLQKNSYERPRGLGRWLMCSKIYLLFYSALLLVSYPARIHTQNGLVHQVQILGLVPQTRSIQSNCRMIISSHRNEIEMYRTHKSIIPCVEAGHRNGNPITGSIILIGLTWCVM